MLGAPARIGEIKAIADRHGIPVIEDTAQAAGCRLHGRHLGTFGAIGTFSFDAVKTMTTGEGGMCITSDANLWQRMSEYQDHGHDHLPNPGGRGGEGRPFIGFNYRMMEIQGAIGLAQLAKLDRIVAAQKANKAFLREAVSVLPGVSFREILDAEGDSATFLTFMLPDKEQTAAVNQVLRDQGVGLFAGVRTAGIITPTGNTCSKAKPTVRAAGRSMPTASGVLSTIRRPCRRRRPSWSGL
jgi:8-amino-3,8-dideoxy-alpha-D-manno-octulosonate transaminase